MISSIARSKNRKVERTRKCDSRGTDGGKPIRSSGSILPMVLKYTPMASRSSSASRPKPSEKIVRSSTSSVSRDASAATSMVVPSLVRQRAVSAVGGVHHRRREIQDGLAREDRRQNAALGAPLLVLGAEQAVAKPGREHAALDRVLLIIAGIVEQHAPDGGRLMDQENVLERQAADHDRLFEMLPRPAFQRIALERRDQAAGRRAAWTAGSARADDKATRMRDLPAERYAECHAYLAPAPRALNARAHPSPGAQAREVIVYRTRVRAGSYLVKTRAGPRWGWHSRLRAQVAAQLHRVNLRLCRRAWR